MAFGKRILTVLIVSGTLLLAACPSTRQAGRDTVDMNCNPLALFSAYMMGQCLTGAVMMGVTEPAASGGGASESQTRPGAADAAAAGAPGRN